MTGPTASVDDIRWCDLREEQKKHILRMCSLEGARKSKIRRMQKRQKIAKIFVENEKRIKELENIVSTLIQRLNKMS